MKDKRSNNRAAVSMITSHTVQTRRAPLNGTKTVLFKEALDFADDSGYVYAIYERQGSNFVLKDDAYFSRVHENEEIIVGIVGCGLSFSRFETKNGHYLFILHNNFNVPSSVVA